MSRKTARARWREFEFRQSANELIAELKKVESLLNSADLAGVSIGVEGPVTELWNANLFRARIIDTDMSFSELACSMNESTIERSLFVGAVFDRCMMKTAHVAECDFSEAKMIVNLDGSICERCNFTRTVFAGGKRGFEYGGRRVKFVECDFSGALFERVEFRASRFVGCTFHGARFRGCDFRGVKVENSPPLVASQFEDMELPGWVEVPAGSSARE